MSQMLTEHFKLAVQPFGVTPDTRFLYLSQTHREALASLLYGIRSGRGFTALIAPPGMGKTTLLFQVLKLLRGNAKTAFLFQTLCGTEEFLRSLLGDLGIEHESDDATRMQAKLNAYLVGQSNKGHEVVVVIDEAQNLDDRVLELLRMLSNFETPGKKLMQLILSGQPQLAEKLASERFTQLRQRISIVAKLNPFTPDETREYIEHRLHLAGASAGIPIFSRQAYAVIAEHSAGIPRNINNLCFNSMSLACALKRPQVEAFMVRETIHDLDLATITASNSGEVQPRPWSTLFSPVASRRLSWRHAVVLGLGFLCALAALFQLWTPWNDHVLARHAANAVQQKTTGNSDPSQSLPVAATALPTHAQTGSRNTATSTGNPPRNSEALEKAPASPGESSVPFELIPQREKR